MFKEMDINTYRSYEKKIVDSLPKLFENIPSNTYREKIISLSGVETRVMVYYPPTEQTEMLPVFVNLHGGGFVVGFAEGDDIFCRLLANEARCVVVNLDYLLAPENPFPGALEECYRLMKWMWKNPSELKIDPRRMGIGGHSAGGNLAASVCLLAKERKEFPIKCQIIDYAPLNLATSPKLKNRIGSATDVGEKADDLLELAEKYNGWYLRKKEDGFNPLVSPILAADLTDLPPALIIAAEYDVLFADDEQYAKRLSAAGVEVQYRLFTGCNHGFTHRGPREAAMDAWMLMAAFLRKYISYGQTEESI
jgi:acetyl esterase